VFKLNGDFKDMENKFIYPIDGNGCNCRAENLALASRSVLRKREYLRGRYKCLIPTFSKQKKAAIRKKAALKTRKKIYQYQPDGTLIAIHSSLTAAARKNKVFISNVGHCASGKIKILKGHIYRYENNPYHGELKDWHPQGGYNVIQYSLGGKKIAGFKSIKEAALQLKIHPNGIADTAYKKSKYAGGFVWRFEGDAYNGEYRDVLKKRKCVQLTLSGRKIRVFKSVGEAVRQTGADFSGIKRVADGLRKSCKGYKWEWVGNPL
jgi:hypothetical protein